MASAQNAEVHRINTQLVADFFGKPDAGPDHFKQVYEAFLAGLEVPADATFEHVDADGVPSIWCSAPGASRDRAIIHYHSGGYVIGSADGYRQFGARLSAATGVRVLLPDYRLAPEHLYPASVDDGLTAYRWLRKQYAAKGTVVTGDSAGGAMTMCTLHSLRAAGEEMPAGAVCMSPYADLAATGESVHANRDKDPLIDPELIAAMAAMYVGDTGASLQDPRVSPLYGEFHDLPPMLFLVGDIECLRDDARRCFEKAKAAGVEAILHEGADMVHIWPIFADRLPEAREALAMIGSFIGDRFKAAV
ncbi:MAG TPA: alpha/beta hydrolase [Solirubrobacteraceae bacterium]|jgi:monoterpene epsilon-lactone hydrolase|nr:alpha/beta hydrolase [Solirubrobacteraceae bacterium]